MKVKPVIVADSFHFSHYYWREHGAPGSDAESDSESQMEAYKPKPVPMDKLKLKFYAQGMLNLFLFIVQWSPVAAEQECQNRFAVCSRWIVLSVFAYDLD